jgi:phosphoenolpyruvate carboxykinase (ATP)
MPKALAGLDVAVLDPRSSYDAPDGWEERARKLGGLFIENFEKFTDTEIGKNLVKAGPKL